jgi:hypothetical protein
VTDEGAERCAQALADNAIVGTWTAKAGCRHGGGETLTLTITRDAEGRLHGATDWARSSSDGRRGAAVPFTTVTAEGETLVATATANGRTIRLRARVEGDTISGSWLTDGDDDKWEFAGGRDAVTSGPNPR